MIANLADWTVASDGLLNSAEQGAKVRDVPAWTHRQSNIAAAREHFLISACNADRSISSVSDSERVQLVNQWLQEAFSRSNSIDTVLDDDARTQTQHVQAWMEAFNSYTSWRGVRG